MNNLPAVVRERWAGDSSLRTQHLCGHYVMSEEFVTLAELSGARKTNFLGKPRERGCKEPFSCGLSCSCRLWASISAALRRPMARAFLRFIDAKAERHL